jgi:hypothetical protein
MEITNEQEELGIASSVDQELSDISLGLEEDLNNLVLEDNTEENIEDLFDESDLFED